MIAVLVPPGGVVPGDVVPLTPEEVHHLRVRRAGEDVPVGIRDGEGLVGDGVDVAFEVTGNPAVVRAMP